MREANSYAYTNNDRYCYTQCHCISDSHCEPNAIRAISDTVTNAICNIYPYFNADHDATANSHT